MRQVCGFRRLFGVGIRQAQRRSSLERLKQFFSSQRLNTAASSWAESHVAVKAPHICVIFVTVEESLLRTSSGGFRAIARGSTWNGLAATWCPDWEVLWSYELVFCPSPQSFHSSQSRLCAVPTTARKLRITHGN
jgi:hypothetical protein